MQSASPYGVRKDCALGLLLPPIIFQAELASGLPANQYAEHYLCLAPTLVFFFTTHLSPSRGLLQNPQQAHTITPNTPQSISWTSSKSPASPHYHSEHTSVHLVDFFKVLSQPTLYSKFSNKYGRLRRYYSA